ncbi:MAG: uroporphyrinogen-III synthase, partial [Actinomycetota bacterium]|nr:uroporphyrinogen-III synthase [Actinomycetota bacterium]
MNGRPLSGRRIVVTREHPGELDGRLAELGADVRHLALIETAEPEDGGAALAGAIARLAEYDWVVVTSPNGARRMAEAVTGPSAPAIAVACVGEATADVLRAHGRQPQLVPRLARLDGLLDVFPQGRGRVLVARADRADTRLVCGLQERGWT